MTGFVFGGGTRKLPGKQIIVVKKKLQRFEEIKSFSHVIQASFDEVFNKDFRLKGKWNKEVFNNDFPIVLELGCGKGEYCIGLAEKYTKKNFIGIDIKGARIWRGGKTVIEKGLKNVVFLRIRIDFINSFFSKDEISEIWITFPDPQNKKPKKRLISSRFLNMYKTFLNNNGIIHLKTDSELLYYYNQAIVKENKLTCLFATENLYGNDIPNNELAILTFYEKQFLQQGLKITYQKFLLPSNKNIKEPIDFEEYKYKNICQKEA